MLTATTRLSRWQALSAQLLAVLDHAASWTDDATTLDMTRHYRAKLVKDIAWSKSYSGGMEQDAILSTLLDKWGPNGLEPAVYDCEASARRHAKQEMAA